jgi:hypothetical protein
MWTQASSHGRFNFDLFLCTDKLVSWEIARNRLLDHCLVTIGIQKPIHNLRSHHRVDSRNIYLDKFGETVPVKVENEIMNKVKPIAGNDKGKLIREFHLFEDVLDFRSRAE